MINFRFSKCTFSLALATATTLFATGSVLAQPPEGDQPPPPPRRDGGEAGGGGRGLGRGDMGMFMQRMQPASIFVSNDYVYVLRSNTLYQFAVKGLKLVNKVQLEEEAPMPTPMPREGGRQGGASGGQGAQPPPTPPAR